MNRRELLKALPVMSVSLPLAKWAGGFQQMSLEEKIKKLEEKLLKQEHELTERWNKHRREIQEHRTHKPGYERCTCGQCVEIRKSEIL